MAYRIAPHADASEEDLSTVARLRVAVQTSAMVFLLLELRSKFNPRKPWDAELAYLMERVKSPLLTKLFESLDAAGVSPQAALSVPMKVNLLGR